ncbi:MAG: hypothetical protein DDT28_01274 [Dehalococcoidia bacterium]|nr:hypothetical protein [Chloroflexota bacterium]
MLIKYDLQEWFSKLPGIVPDEVYHHRVGPAAKGIERNYTIDILVFNETGAGSNYLVFASPIRTIRNTIKRGSKFLVLYHLRE